MSSNWHYGDHKAEALNVADIEVGDILIRANWDYRPAKWEEEEWVVTKVLKSRLQIERTRPEDGRVMVKRLLVRNSKTYTYSNGEVETDVEGSGSGYRYGRTGVYLFTPDEPLLAELRNKVAVAKVEQDARNAADRAIVEFTRTLSVDDAEATIAALRAYIATQGDKA